MLSIVITLVPIYIYVSIQAVSVQCDFGCGCGSLMHLVCALGLPEMIQSLLRKSQPNTKIWSVKDGEGMRVRISTQTTQGAGVWISTPTEPRPEISY